MKLILNNNKLWNKKWEINYQLRIRKWIEMKESLNLNYIKNEKPRI